MGRALSSIQVGDEFELERTADPYRAMYYAAASGDFNAIHLDPEVGKKAGLGGPILHGMCTMAWMVETAVVFFGDPTVIAKVRTRFSRPVALGDVVRFKGKVTAIANGRISTEISATNQRGEDVLKNGLVEARLAS